MFSQDQVRALQTLVRLWSVERFVLIGASAIRLQTGDRSRETHDVDLILGVPFNRYPAGLNIEAGWSRHPKREHRWIGPQNVYVDVIPVGGEAEAQTSLTWPESGFEMTLTGMRLAMDRALTIQVAAGLMIRVAPLEVIALLKMVAYLDRPLERDRDLEDIAFILDEFIGARDDRRYADEILDLGLKFEEISPFLLGRSLAEFVNEQERKSVEEFIQLVKGVEDRTRTQAGMLVSAPLSWNRDPEELLVRIAAFERGFGSSPRKV